jgi:hypothetical protein
VFVLDEPTACSTWASSTSARRSRLPRATRQTLFFSATMPREAQELADQLLHDPQTVAVAPPSTTVELVDQEVFFVEKADKRALLVDVMRDAGMRRVLIFSRTKHGANRIAEHLDKAGVRAEAIHGNKSQNARERALANFKAGKIRALVATDIAARGIDIDDVTHVVNFDVPEVPETYVHRIGRTGRAGATGMALTFCEVEERADLREIEKLTRQALPIVEGHPYESTIPFDVVPPRKTSQQKAQQGRRDRGGAAVVVAAADTVAGVASSRTSADESSEVPAMVGEWSPRRRRSEVEQHAPRAVDLRPAYEADAGDTVPDVPIATNRSQSRSATFAARSAATGITCHNADGRIGSPHDSKPPDPDRRAALSRPATLAAPPHQAAVILADADRPGALMQAVDVLRDDQHRRARGQALLERGERAMRRSRRGIADRAPELPEHPADVRTSRGHRTHVGERRELLVVPQPAGSAIGRQAGALGDSCSGEHDDAAVIGKHRVSVNHTPTVVDPFFRLTRSDLNDELALVVKPLAFDVPQPVRELREHGPERTEQLHRVRRAVEDRHREHRLCRLHARHHLIRVTADVLQLRNHPGDVVGEHVAAGLVDLDLCEELPGARDLTAVDLKLDGGAERLRHVDASPASA